MINLILISILINFFLVLYYKKINFFSVYSNEKGKKISLVGGNILILNLIFYFIFNISFNNLPLNEFFIERRQLYSFLISSIGIYFMGAFDDKYNLRPIAKLFIMILLISFSILGDNKLLIDKLRFLDFEIELRTYSLFFSIFCFLAFINAINMFDGINLQLVFYSSFLLIFLILNSFFTHLSIVLIIALVFFSMLNFEDKSFLGNSGSHLLGFLLAYFLVKFYNLNKGFVYAEEILCLMLIPGLDMLRVSIKRIIIGKNPLSGDEDHLHHRIKNKLNSNYALIINFLITIIPIIIYKIYNLNLFYVIFLGLIIYGLIFFIFKFNMIFEERK